MRIALPPERFFWAVLDSSPLKSTSGRSSVKQLGFLLENVLPLPLEEVHAVYRRIPRHKKSFVACAMDRRTLDTELSKASESPIALQPQSLPQFVADLLGTTEFHVDTLNLLVDEYQPPAQRAAKRRLWAQVTIVIAACAALLVVGLERRTAHQRRQVSDLQAARSAIYSQALGPSTSKQPQELLLTAELRRLRQTRQQPAEHLQVEDCTPILASLLGSWPADVYMQTESISITPTAITIRGSAPGSSDVQRLASALSRDEGLSSLSGRGWQLQQPQVNSERDGVQATLQFTRANTAEGRP